MHVQPAANMHSKAHAKPKLLLHSSCIRSYNERYQRPLSFSKLKHVGPAMARKHVTAHNRAKTPGATSRTRSPARRGTRGPEMIVRVPHRRALSQSQPEGGNAERVTCAAPMGEMASAPKGEHLQGGQRNDSSRYWAPHQHDPTSTTATHYRQQAR